MNKLSAQLLATLPLGTSTILILDAKAQAKRGKFRHILLTELSSLAQEHGISSACIHAKPLKGRGHTLSFYGVPPALQQRMRNVWTAYE
ncbi:hypothetical protein P3T73_05770 [Kiritimatiellota bacterium B12222]|nr:hypothetical protein P3T73_05770 [Kiritimatiellota bacterium B12222]